MVNEASFDLASGETLGIAGESGSGKSTLARALLGHARGGSRIESGSILLGGRDLVSLSPKALASRLENSKTDRPLIRNLKGDELEGFISAKLAEREPFYNQSKFVVSASDLTAERLAFYLNLG